MRRYLQKRFRHGFTLVESGFTLVESVVAVSVVSLAVIFSLGLIPTFKISNRRAGLEIQAGGLAQTLVEQQRALPFADIVSSTGDTIHPVDGIDFASRVQVEDVTAGKSKRIKVEIDWTWKEQSHSTFRETIVCRIPRA